MLVDALVLAGAVGIVVNELGKIMLVYVYQTIVPRHPKTK